MEKGKAISLKRAPRQAMKVGEYISLLKYVHPSEPKSVWLVGGLVSPIHCCAALRRFFYVLMPHHYMAEEMKAYRKVLSSDAQPKQHLYVRHVARLD